MSAYCVGWHLKDLLDFGFSRTPPGKTESRPAPAFSLLPLTRWLTSFFRSLGELPGPRRFPTSTHLLAPFIRNDRTRTTKTSSKPFQQFVFNLNVSTRVGFQSPFTNLTFRPATAGHPRQRSPQSSADESQPETYGDFAPRDGDVQSGVP